MDSNDLFFLIGGAVGGFLSGFLHCLSRRKAYRDGVRDAHRQMAEAEAAQELLRTRDHPEH